MSPRNLLLALGLVLLVTSLALVSADSDDGNTSDALKVLQQLDRYYSQIARPRPARSEAAAGAGVVEGGNGGPQSRAQVQVPNLASAVKMLQLHSLDNFYYNHMRPRYGKRASMHAAWERDNPVDPDRPENWLSFHRRR